MIGLLLSVFLVAVITVVMCGAGFTVSRAVLGGQFRATEYTGTERLLVSFLVGSLLFQFAIWAGGTIWFGAALIWILVILFAALTLPSGRQLAADVSHQWQIAWAGGRLYKFAIVLLAVLFILLIISANAPPADGDSLTYRLRLIKRDVELGFFGPAVEVSRYYFYPRLLERIGGAAYLIGGETAGQLAGVVFLFFVCAAIAALGQRLGMRREAIAIGLLIFVTIRTVVFQAPTLHNDLALTFGTMVALLALVQMRFSDFPGWLVVAAVALAYGLNTKYTGLQVGLAAVITALAFSFRKCLSVSGVGAAALALVLIAPLLIHNAILTGNPLFPLFDFVFGDPENSWQRSAQALYGRGNGIIEFLISPVDQFLFPNTFFDGHQWGAPLVLITLPFGIWALRREQKWHPIWVFLVLFYVVWFFFVIQQVRFLTPIMPLLALVCGAGIVWLWEMARDSRLSMAVFGLVFLALAANQSLFVGGQMAERILVGSGVIARESFLARQSNTHYETCRFISTNLRKNATYVSTLSADYYCPQAAKLSSATFSVSEVPTADVLDRYGVQFVVFQINSVQKFRSRDASPFKLEIDRPWQAIETASWKFPADFFDGLTPVVEDQQARVYLASDIIERARAIR